uniref:Achalasia, adrenocortical insufficiency, alacrimia n=1 Tax=Oryzias latipes TaxID=8090 RepID=A0A3P9J7Z3_ORYLA
MCSLTLFPPPLPDGQTTLCESNNELLSGSNTQVCLSSHTAPMSLHFPRESLKLHSRTESSSKAAFLDHSETLWMRSAAAWRDGGLPGLLNEITDSNSEVPKWLAVGSGCILALLRWISSFHSSLFPHLTLSSEDMIAEFSQVLNWSDCVVRAFAWHPHTDKFAVALLDESIKIYNPKSTTTPTLKHRLQRNVAAMQWKPLCASALAVACQNCVLVWHVDPCSLSARPSSSCAQVLSHPCHAPVTSIAWSPSGALLLSASPMDTSMMVWDVAAESCVPLQRVGGGGVTFLSWSPDGSHVLASTPSALFRLDLQTWLFGVTNQGAIVVNSNTEVKGLKSRIQVFMQRQTKIYFSGFGRPGCGPVSGVIADVNDRIFVGGEIQSLAWDPRGERLAVLLKGDPQVTNRPAIIAVFKTRTSPIFELLPCGFVQGEPGVEPRLMQFHPNFQHGALLTVCWSSGRIAHVPFYFLTSAVPLVGLSGSPSLLHPLERPADFASQSLFTELLS